MKNLDFLPERIKAQRAKRQRLIRQGYLLVICIAMLALLGYIRQGRIAEARGEIRKLQDRADAINKQKAMLGDLEKKLAELRIMERIDNHLGSRVSTLDVMAELEHLIPKEMTVTSMKVETMEIQVPITQKEKMGNPSRATAAGKKRKNKKTKTVKRIRLILTGVVTSDVAVANFIGQLSASKLFEDVNMGYSRNTSFRGKNNVREFQVVCNVIR